MRCSATTTAINSRSAVIALALLLGSITFWEYGYSATQLDRYVGIAINQNLALSQERLTVLQSAAAARETFGMLLPSLELNTRYSDVSGNPLDLGNLINPAYATLNQLIGEQRFPTDLSIRIPYRQETKLRLIQPILLPKAYFGYRARRNLVYAVTARLEVATRDLVAEVKTSYYNYAKADRALQLYDQTIQLLEENLRVNQKLVERQKATLDVLYRAKAELSDVRQKRAEAELQRSVAARYFNFLLNRGADEAIERDSDSLIGDFPLPAVDSALQVGRTGRPEYRQIVQGLAAAANSIRAHNSDFLPTVALAVDYGFQGDDYRFDTRKDITTLSIVASWNLFNGGQDRARRQQAVLSSRRLTLQKEELIQQIELQIRQAHDAVLVASQARLTASDRLESARRSFEIVSRRYAEGMASQVEYLDARTSYTSAGINQITSTYDYAQKFVQFERATAIAALPSDPTLTGK